MTVRRSSIGGQGSLRVNRNLLRVPTLSTDQYSVNAPYYEPRQHGDFVHGVCDELGRQYVIALTPETSLYSERVLTTSAGAAVASAFVAESCMLQGVFGYNAHASSVLFVQLWEGLSRDVPNTLTSLRAVIPVQPNYGIFSLDMPLPFRFGCNIAISTSPTAFASPGNQLVFTAYSLQMEKIGVDNP